MRNPVGRKRYKTKISEGWIIFFILENDDMNTKDKKRTHFPNEGISFHNL